MQHRRIVLAERVAQHLSFRQFVEQLPEAFCQQGKVIHNGRNKIRLMDVRDLNIPGISEVVVKRYHRPNIFQKMDYSFFRKPKCRKAFYNTKEIRRRGLPAVEELAYMEIWKNHLFQYGFFISMKAPGVRLDHLVIDLQEQGNKGAIQSIISQFALLLKRMHEQGILYNDMNCGNVLCKQNDQTGSWDFCLVDTNRAHLYNEHRPLPLNACIPDIILMNPKMGTVESFITEYLQKRGMYTIKEVRRIRQIQHKRHEKKHTMKSLFSRYRELYYRRLD